jgi:hypothetical protein
MIPISDIKLKKYERGIQMQNAKIKIMKSIRPDFAFSAYSPPLIHNLLPA